MRAGPRTLCAALLCLGWTAPSMAQDPGSTPDSKSETSPLATSPLATSKLESAPLESSPGISLVAEPSRVELGGPVQVTLEVTAGREDQVTVPSQSLGTFDVLNRNAPVVSTVNGKTVHRFQLSLLALVPGEQSVGPLEVRILSRDGVVTEKQSPRIAVEVTSPIANEPTPELKPPTPPVVVMQDDYRLLWVALGVLGLLLAVLFGLWLSRWLKRRPAEVPPPPPPIPPWEEAAAALQTLRQEMGRPSSEDADGPTVEVPDGWFDRLSDVFRRYLGRRLGFDGLESTTDEVLARVQKSTGIPGVEFHELVHGASGVLGDCDLIKFAKATPSQSLALELWTRAESLVRLTTPARVAGQPPQQTLPSTENTNQNGETS